MINIGAYIGDHKQLKDIGVITQYFNQKYKYINFHIFTDDILTDYVNSAILSSFYMTFFRDTIIFMCLEDYLLNQDNIMTENVYILTSKKDLELNHKTKNCFAQNIKILTIKNGEANEI